MRNRNIKLNVFLNEEEHDLLKYKTRKLIKNYEVNPKSK